MGCDFLLGVEVGCQYRIVLVFGRPGVSEHGRDGQMCSFYQKLSLSKSRTWCLEAAAPLWPAESGTLSLRSPVSWRGSMIVQNRRLAHTLGNVVGRVADE